MKILSKLSISPSPLLDQDAVRKVDLSSSSGGVPDLDHIITLDANLTNNLPTTRSSPGDGWLVFSSDGKVVICMYYTQIGDSILFANQPSIGWNSVSMPISKNQQYTFWYSTVIGFNRSHYFIPFK